MKSYIGAKIISAEPMDQFTFQTKFKAGETTIDSQGNSPEGYHIVYPDNYHSWSPKEVFEEAYRLVSEKEIVSFAKCELPGTLNDLYKEIQKDVSKDAKK